MFAYEGCVWRKEEKKKLEGWKVLNLTDRARPETESMVIMTASGRHEWSKGSLDPTVNDGILQHVCFQTTYLSTSPDKVPISSSSYVGRRLSRDKIDVSAPVKGETVVVA